MKAGISPVSKSRLCKQKIERFYGVQVPPGRPSKQALVRVPVRVVFGDPRPVGVVVLRQYSSLRRNQNTRAQLLL